MISNELKADIDWIKQFVPNTNPDFDVTNPETLTFLINEYVKLRLTSAAKEFSIDFLITRSTRINVDRNFLKCFYATQKLIYAMETSIQLRDAYITKDGVLKASIDKKGIEKLILQDIKPHQISLTPRFNEKESFQKSSTAEPEIKLGSIIKPSNPSQTDKTLEDELKAVDSNDDIAPDQKETMKEHIRERYRGES